ncbi:MAG: hypothetical protein DME50_10640 [Verrucomicrobia bacterium]|nr:MAG: hypothetical protein DME50_10640 [Verrucomicrobiota bacterium]
MKTLSCNGHRELAGVRYHHGDELPPNILNEELADYWLDHRLAIEHDDTERRSLYRLFAPFSGTLQTEPIELDAELAQYVL